MTHELSLRVAELQRRAETLEAELAGWVAACQQRVRMEIHTSQLDAVNTLVSVASARARDRLKHLPESAADVRLWSLQLADELDRGQRIWNFFRAKLDLRNLATLDDPLWIADTIAYDCYQHVMTSVIGLNLITDEKAREPPLTFVEDHLSALTWTRRSRPFDGRNYALGEATLPIPVIALPWDHIRNHWEQVAIAHEVGHDLEADLNLRRSLEEAIDVALRAQLVAVDRIGSWKRWAGEIFADLVALELVGPCYLDALLKLLWLPEGQVVNEDPDDPHPIPFVRIHLCASYAKSLAADGGAVPDTIVSHVEQLLRLWDATYTDTAHLAEFLRDASHVAEAVMRTAHPVLGGLTMTSLVSYRSSEEKQVRRAVEYLATGNNQGPKLAPRLVIAASHLAATKCIQTDAASVAAGSKSRRDELLDGVNTRASEMIHLGAPAGTRGGSLSPRRMKFIESYFDRTTI